MLDAELMDQLRNAFSTLENEISLVCEPTFHEDQSQLLELLNGVAAASTKIQVRTSPPPDGRQALAPKFHVEKNNVRNGVSFRGIPSGHEFTSLVLAILNSDSKGKLPDQLLLNRVKRIKGPVEITTYMSLTCENCPDVVQALNIMAISHGNFKHETVDGAYAPEEIETLGIQGVPSVVANGKLIHSGRINFLDLLEKLEKHFGVSEGESIVVDANLGNFDTVVIGGGPAGASAAIYSVRKGLKTAIVTDKIGGQVQETKGIENLISVTYTEGPQLAAQLNQHLSAYPIKIFENRKVKQIGPERLKKVDFESGEFLFGKNIIVATGAKWRELGIPGEKDYLGRGVAFCPHCDGPFYKGKKIAVIGGGNSGVEAAIDLAGIVKQVVLIEYLDQLKADKILVDKLRSLSNVEIITGAKALEILGNGQKVQSLKYLERSTETEKNILLDGIFIQIGLVPNTQFLKGHLNLTPFGEIIVDQKGRTSVPGIYAAGDATTTPYKQIIIAMGEGAKAALASFEDQMLLPS